MELKIVVNLYYDKIKQESIELVGSFVTSKYKLINEHLLYCISVGIRGIITEYDDTATAKRLAMILL